MSRGLILEEGENVKQRENASLHLWGMDAPGNKATGLKMPP